MANLGTAWHIPANPEPRGRAGMRDPVFPTVSSAATSVTISTGNQFAGVGNPGNQLQDGSSLFFRRATDPGWEEVPLAFAATIGNNKYYSASIPTGSFPADTAVQYYLRVAYDDHDTTFLHASADGTVSVVTADEGVAQAAPFAFTMETRAARGEWLPVFSLPNAAIHAHVLPNGLVLMWGRRDEPDQSLDVDPRSRLHRDEEPAPAARCTPFLWDPSTKQVTSTPRPTSDDGTPANLFCSGHSFLPDGRLFVAGGHLSDGHGLDLTTIYDPVGNTWTPNGRMAHGRWYPTVIGLPDGRVLVLWGTYRNPDPTSPTDPIPNTVPEVWDGKARTEIASPEDQLDLYPRAHVASTGKVFTTGIVAKGQWLEVSGGGHWTPLGTERAHGYRDYAPSVLYDLDRAIYVGGGNPPIANAELLDVSQAAPRWRDPAPLQMSFPRRQHNATILPDGTVLVTGGTRGGDFNNLGPGQPVHVAELWDPRSGGWTPLAAEQIDRCYHSTAVLLPDATVLSAGGGEFFLIEGVEQNDPLDTHRDAQVFRPPYLFRGPQPVISSAPDAVGYGETFHVETDQADEIEAVTWIGLSSVTHSFNSGQRFNALAHRPSVGGLDVTAPSSPNVCPPGHYMMFILNGEGVPSVAKILRVVPAPREGPDVAELRLLRAPELDAERAEPLDALAQRETVLAAAGGTKVVLGITGTCPYGMAVCWGGANEALHRLEGVHLVDPIPDGGDSTATVFLVDDRLPPLTRWNEQFRRLVHDSYTVRGVEVTLQGRVETHDENVFLDRGADGPPVLLAPLDPAGKIQWDRTAGAPQAAQPSEVAAYEALVTGAGASPERLVTVTGPLVQIEVGYRLEVRLVEA